MCVEAPREVGGDRPQEVDHPLPRLLRERQEHRRVGLVVQERELLEPPVRPPPQPAGVRPEEVVEIAELVGVHGRPPAAEARDGVAVAQLDDGHLTSGQARRSTGRFGRARPGLVGSWTPGAPAPALVERQRGVDEREVRERLGEVPDEPPASDVVLLGEQAEVVPERRAAARRAPPPRRGGLQREHLDEPERARKERPFAGREAVDADVLLVGAVALDEAVAHQLPLDRRDRAHDPRVVRGEEADDRHQQQARVEPRRAVGLHERAELRVEPLAADLVVDLVAERAPALDRAVEPVAPRRSAPHGRTRPTPSPSSA